MRCPTGHQMHGGASEGGQTVSRIVTLESAWRDLLRFLFRLGGLFGRSRSSRLARSNLLVGLNP